MRVSEIRVNQIRVNQGLGVFEMRFHTEFDPIVFSSTKTFLRWLYLRI